MKILIIGATGKTGQKLLENLSVTSHEVTGLIRNQAQENLVTQFGAKFLIGDLEGDLSQLGKEFDVILFVAGSRGKNVEGVDYAGVVKTVQYALNSGIKRLLYLSSINIGKSTEQLVAEIKKYYQDNGEIAPEGLLTMAQKPEYQNYLHMKTLAEQAIIESGLDYTIYRAGLLTEQVGTKKINVVSGTLNAFGKISRDNVAQCFIGTLENERTYQKIFTILDGETDIQTAF